MTTAAFDESNAFTSVVTPSWMWPWCSCPPIRAAEETSSRSGRVAQAPSAAERTIKSIAVGDVRLGIREAIPGLRRMLLFAISRHEGLIRGRSNPVTFVDRRLLARAVQARIENPDVAKFTQLLGGKFMIVAR